MKRISSTTPLFFIGYSESAVLESSLPKRKHQLFLKKINTKVKYA